MRSHILAEPNSQLAVWARRLAVFSLLLACIGLLVIRSKAVETVAGIAVFGAAILLACIALLMAAAAIVVIWQTGRKGAGHVTYAIVLSVLLLAYPAYLAIRAVQLPVINDIATDVNDPPQFSESTAALQARSGLVRSKELAGALLQQGSYSDIQPIVIDLEASEVYELVVKTVQSLGWQIIERQPATEAREAVFQTRRVRRGRGRPVTQRVQVSPAKQATAGRLDAVARSLIMGFPDDVTIRIRPLEAQTQIDVRSASRYGRHDFGANAARIRKFAAELQGQLDLR